MRLITKIISLALLGGSAVFGVLIIQDGRSPIVALPQTENQKSENLPNNSAILENTTQQIAQKVASELGPISDLNDLKNIEPEKIIDETILKQLENFDYSSLFPEIKNEDIKIAGSHDSKMKDSYIKNIQAITQKAIAGLSINSANPSPKDFQKLSDAYQKIVANLYNLVAPKNMANFHKEVIKIFGAQANVFKNLASYETDPLKAMASLPLLEETTRQLATLWNQYAK
jgi:hypothetical protein